MKTLRCFSAIVSLSLLCSCTSTSVQPTDPFAAQPVPTPTKFEPIVQAEQRQEETVVAQPKLPEPKSDVLMYQPEYKPTYQPIQAPSSDGLVPKPTRIVRHADGNFEHGIVAEVGVIRPVVYLQENDPFSDNGAVDKTETKTKAADDSVQEPKPEPASPPQLQENPLNRIAIDPALNAKGAAIVAARQNGHETFHGPWRPDRRSEFWPQDEYLADGGDGNTKVYVKEDWSVHNLQLEDTVVHYDTIDGRTEVEPSNRVHLYAPRFGSVRKIEGILNNDQITALSGANAQLALNVDNGRQSLGYAAQETGAGYARTRDNISGVGSSKKIRGATGTRVLAGFEGIDAVMLYTNWLTQTSVGGVELAYLAEGSVNARAWQGEQGVKIRINALAPMSASSEEGAESFFQVKSEGITNKIRLIKVASKKVAQPGEIVEFTLRYDNLGTHPVGNVTVLDNLTTRLEFLPGTAKSSRPSGFIAEPNDGGSFTLRWEITDPLEPMEFGVVQFQCRVR